MCQIVCCRLASHSGPADSIVLNDWLMSCGMLIICVCNLLLYVVMLASQRKCTANNTETATANKDQLYTCTPTAFRGPSGLFGYKLTLKVEHWKNVGNWSVKVPQLCKISPCGKNRRFSTRGYFACILLYTWANPPACRNMLSVPMGEGSIHGMYNLYNHSQV